MNILPALLATASLAAILVTGYLLGARRGRSARRALHDALESEKRASASLAHALDVQKAESVSAIREEVARALESVATVTTREDDGVREMRAEIRKILDAIDHGEQVRRADATRGARVVHEAVRSALAPILEREALGRELAKVDAGRGLGELPRVLDAIAERGGFTTVLLSDDDGLPLASSHGSRDVERTAGMSSLFLTLVDRVENGGAPRPTSVVLRDEAGQTTLHRILHVGATRFLLTVVSRQSSLGPDALDPALVKIERALARPEPS